MKFYVSGRGIYVLGRGIYVSGRGIKFLPKERFFLKGNKRKKKRA